ncbi:MAG: caspase family protein, partial [Treponema sp.]|nr:caspase family protein [Treponema sp.]
MKKAVLFSFILLVTAFSLYAQEPQKYALVIGNGAYTSFGSLRNAVNDAEDVSAALQSLGFNVDRVINAGRTQMFDAIIRFKNRLSVSNNSYGFFYYAGHAVQYN